MKNRNYYFLLVFSVFFTISVFAQDDEKHSAQELATKLANPVANLISLPIQNNFDFSVGPFDGFKFTMNIQPVIPISIGENWNMISRTILPVIGQNNVVGADTNEFGIGDIAQSLFFSPKAPTSGGLVWGVGPIFLLPTATNDVLGLNKWTAGPNVVVLKLQGHWTYGFLANHMWSFAGSGPSDISATFFQPFATYATSSGSSFTLASENTQSWNNDIFNGFIGFYYAKVLKFGKQALQLGGGPKVFYGNNPMYPKWGIRANIILLFPK